MYGAREMSSELAESIVSLEEAARNSGLDPFTTIFEVVDYKQLNEIAAYGGFPTRYPHWRWGMEYEQLSKSYTWGLSIIYEMVINTDPCYAYLLRANSMVFQKTVIAHVYGHSDFFKNNYWFSKTNRKMLDQMANHATVIRNLVEEVGQEEVENFIDTCLSIDNLIDIHAPHNPPQKKLSEEEISQLEKRPVSKLSSKKYMDKYINPKEFVDSQKEKIRSEAEREKSFPERPQKDILKFLIDFAPVESWKKRVLEVIRNEAYYFAPQGQTKILNEGWATYWHSKMMTQIAPLSDSEIVDYCDHYAGVVASHPSQLNPYKLGVELLRYIEDRWNKGKYGKEWLDCGDYKERQKWDRQTGGGLDKLFEVRKFHNDITFIDDFLDEDFCHEHKMFLYDFDQRSGKQVISSRSFSDVKSQLLKQLTNFGQPRIEVIDGNFRNRGELLLSHGHDGVDLKHQFTLECLKSLHAVWTRPVHIETILEKEPKRVSFDGSSHSVEKL